MLSRKRDRGGNTRGEEKKRGEERIGEGEVRGQEFFMSLVLCRLSELDRSGVLSFCSQPVCVCVCVCVCV